MNVGHNPSAIFSESLGAAVSTASTPSVNPLKNVAKLAKLSFDEVIMLKLYYHWEGLSQPQLAERFGVSQSAVNMILKKKTYKNVVLNHMTKIPEQFHFETNNRYRDKKFKGHQ